jgi:hypothetical protein
VAEIEIELDAYVLPDGHRVWKLFPGSSYRLYNEIVNLRAALLDIRGLETLADDPAEWTDEQLRKIISDDRVLREMSGKQKKLKRPSQQDTKRLRFVKLLFREARAGDLIAIPLGRGLEGEVAIGEFTGGPGDVRPVKVHDGQTEFSTLGRPVRWMATTKRRRFSNDLNSRLHSPTAFHVLERSLFEEVYLAAYGSFTYDDIYVASFPSDKEWFTTADQAAIGIWFNGVAVIHDRKMSGQSIPEAEDFIELGLEDANVELELLRNSPLSIVVRTVGPLAFSALALYPMAANGHPLSDVKTATVSAKTVGGAPDKCKVVVPADLSEIAQGLGFRRWDQHCRVGKKVKDGADVKSTSRLKQRPKGHK